MFSLSLGPDPKGQGLFIWSLEPAFNLKGSRRLQPAQILIIS
jgi:hypothetical protein